MSFMCPFLHLLNSHLFHWQCYYFPSPLPRPGKETKSKVLMVLYLKLFLESYRQSHEELFMLVLQLLSHHQLKNEIYLLSIVDLWRGAFQFGLMPSK